jgi:hypothetical protein
MQLLAQRQFSTAVAENQSLHASTQGDISVPITIITVDLSLYLLKICNVGLSLGVLTVVHSRPMFRVCHRYDAEWAKV